MAKRKESFSARAKKLVDKPRVPYRDIEKEGVHYTFLSQFLQCRETARLSHVEGLQQAGMIPPLEFGQLFHLGFELLASGKPASQITRITKKYVDNTLAKRKIPPDQREELHRLRAIVNVMFPLYADYYQSPKSKTSGETEPRGIEFQSTTKCVAQEVPFEVFHTVPSGRTIRIYGRFDGILRVGVSKHYSGDLWLMENKTKSIIDSDGLTAYLPSDLQTMLYCYALSREDTQRKLGLGGKEPVTGIVYNVVKRPGHKWNRDKETLDQHAERIRGIVAEDLAGFFPRWHVSLSQVDIDRYVRETVDPLLEQVLVWWDSIKGNPFSPFVLADGRPNPHHLRNPEGLYTKYGKSLYFDLLTRGSMYGLIRRLPDGSGQKTGRRLPKPQRSQVRKQAGRRRVKV